MGRFQINSLCTTLVILAMMFSLVACGNTDDSISRKEYNEMKKLIHVNDDYDLIDVRSAINNFAYKYLNATSQEELYSSIESLEPYSTSLLISSLKSKAYYTMEQKQVTGIYYCAKDKSSNQKDKFLVVVSLVEPNTAASNSNEYLLFTLDSNGKISQLEQW